MQTVRRVVVMGVSGSGKSTVAELLASQMGSIALDPAELVAGILPRLN
jgi:adenylate kinase family enzyme